MKDVLLTMGVCILMGINTKLVFLAADYGQITRVLALLIGSYIGCNLYANALALYFTQDNEPKKDYDKKFFWVLSLR